MESESDESESESESVPEDLSDTKADDDERPWYQNRLIDGLELIPQFQPDSSATFTPPRTIIPNLGGSFGHAIKEADESCTKDTLTATLKTLRSSYHLAHKTQPTARW